MSHAHGGVKFPDNTILYFEYNGSVDTCITFLYKTKEEVEANWRRNDWKFHDVNCNKSEPVEIFTTYGGAFSWEGKACKECMLITDNLHPDYSTEIEGVPDWYPIEEEMKQFFKKRE